MVHTRACVNAQIGQCSLQFCTLQFTLGTGGSGRCILTQAGNQRGERSLQKGDMEVTAENTQG